MDKKKRESAVKKMKDIAILMYRMQNDDTLLFMTRTRAKAILALVVPLIEDVEEKEK